MPSGWLLLLLLGSTALTASAQNGENPGIVPYSLEIHTSLVSVDVEVSDRNEKPVTNLAVEDFQVYDDGVLQRIASFTPVQENYRVLLLVDHTGSMAHHWSFLLKGLEGFMKALRPQDKIAVATFDDKVKLAMGWRSAPEVNNTKLKILPDGALNEIWKSVDWSVAEMSRFQGRNAVIVFTDGEDPGNNFATTVSHTVLSGMPFYFIGLTNEASTGAMRMKELAQATGGKAYFPGSSNELPALYSSIAHALGASYTISYNPSSPVEADGVHHIEVRAVDKQFHVKQSRSSYSAH
jgi:VWFA-related protein